MPPGDKQHAGARRARPPPFALTRGASPKCFDPPRRPSVIVRPCACVRGCVCVSCNTGPETTLRLETEGKGDFLLAIFKKPKTKKPQAKSCVPPKKAPDLSFLTPRVTKRRRRVSRRSCRWVQRPRTAAVGWPISICLWLQGTSTLEVLFFLSYLYMFFFGIDCFVAATHPKKEDYFCFFPYFSNQCFT